MTDPMSEDSAQQSEPYPLARGRLYHVGRGAKDFGGRVCAANIVCFGAFNIAGGADVATVAVIAGSIAFASKVGIRRLSSLASEDSYEYAKNILKKEQHIFARTGGTLVLCFGFAGGVIGENIAHHIATSALETNALPVQEINKSSLRQDFSISDLRNRECVVVVNQGQAPRVISGKCKIQPR